MQAEAKTTGAEQNSNSSGRIHGAGCGEHGIDPTATQACLEPFGNQACVGRFTRPLASGSEAAGALS